MLLIILGFLLSKSLSVKMMNVQAGVTAGIAALDVSDSEIDAARTSLGKKGFIAYFPCSTTGDYQKSITDAMTSSADTDTLPFSGV